MFQLWDIRGDYSIYRDRVIFLMTGLLNYTNVEIDLSSSQISVVFMSDDIVTEKGFNFTFYQVARKHNEHSRMKRNANNSSHENLNSDYSFANDSFSFSEQTHISTTGI